MLIEGAVNPLYSQQLSTNCPQDYFLSEFNRIQYIFGGVNSGKSSYCQTLAKLAILAHLGAAIPCSSAILYPLSKIVSVSCQRDQEFRLNSSFENEMVLVERMLKATEKRGSYLVLVDNFGSSTSQVDASKHFKVLSEVLSKRKCLALFATSNLGLLSLANEYPFVSAFQMGTEEGQKFKLVNISKVDNIICSDLEKFEKLIENLDLRESFKRNGEIVRNCLVSDMDVELDPYLNEFFHMVKNVKKLEVDKEKICEEEFKRKMDKIREEFLN